MKKRRIKTWPVILVLVLCCFITLLFCLNDIYQSLKSGNSGQVEILATIDEYGYTLNENDSPYVEKLFKELKKELSKENVNEEIYASLLSQLFVADFYSLQQAINKNDIGGTQFIYESYQNEFTQKAKNSVYANIENNIYGTRKQELPMVSAVEVTNIEQVNYEGDNASDEKSYKVELYITYEKELEYPSHVTLTLIHANQKLQIVKMS